MAEINDHLPEPAWRPLPVLCHECSHQWSDWEPVGVRIALWIDAIRGLRCPQCGAGSRRLAIRIYPADDA